MTTGLVAVVAAAAITVAVTPWVPVTTDEAWFLQVARRVARGERPYREVFFGAAPFVLWVAAVAIRLTRPQVLVIRALGIGYEIATLAATAVLMAAVGAPALALIVTVASSLALAGHHVAMHNHYGLLTNAGLLTAGAAIVADRPVVVGAALSLAVLGKYSVGVIGILVLGPIQFWAGGAEKGAISLTTLAAGLLVTFLLGLGSWGDFYRCAVANKRTFVATAVIRPLDGLRRTLAGMTRLDAWAYGLPAIFGYVALAAGAALLIFATAAAIGRDRVDLAVAGALILCGLAGVYPRADRSHVVAAIPAVVAGCGLAAASAPTQAWLVAGVVALVTLIAGVAGRVAMTRRQTIRRDLPRLRLLPVPHPVGAWPDETGQVRSAADDRVMVLRPDAALFYLAGGLENPTPYDYPYASTFGRHGQAEVIQQIRSGRVPWVCRSMPADDPLAPRELMAFVNDHMTEAAATPIGSLRRLEAGQPV
jgi:hypothetical protein